MNKYLINFPIVTNSKNSQMLTLKIPAINVNGSPIIGNQANNNDQNPNFR